MDRQIILYAIIALVGMMVLLGGVLLGILIGSRTAVPPHRRKGSPRPKNRQKFWVGIVSFARASWGVVKRFFLFLKAHWPKRKKRRKALRTPTPVAPPLPRAKTSVLVIAFLIIALLIILGGVVVAIMLLLPFFALFLVVPVSPEVQQQMNQAFAAVPHETVNEIAGLVLRFVISLLGGRIGGIVETPACG